MGYKIAIDGPSASGKSTVAKRLAKKLNFTHIDTGLMYRLVTYLALKSNKPLDQKETYQFLDNLDFDIKEENIYYLGQNYTSLVRTPEIDKNISLVSSLPFVREKLVLAQRQLADNKNVIMDGRDIATVVLPNAEIKIFLNASVDERAKRRYLENKQRKIEENLDDVKNALLTRDLKDSTREVSPLKKADDATVIDSTNLSIEEVIEKIYLIAKKNLNI